MKFTNEQQQAILITLGIEKQAKVPIKFKDNGNSSYSVYDPTFEDQSLLDKLPFPNHGKGSAFIELHGGGHKYNYILANNQHGNDSEAIVEMGPFKHVNITPGGGNNTLDEALNQLSQKQINKLHSIACNRDGGGRPEFYDNLMGGSLNEVIMTPPGYVGLSGQGVTNTGQKLYEMMYKGQPGYAPSSPQHTYLKEHYNSWLPFMDKDEWKDQGEYTPVADQFVSDHGMSIGAGLAGLTGMSALAYKLYRNNKNKKKSKNKK